MLGVALFLFVSFFLSVSCVALFQVMLRDILHWLRLRDVMGIALMRYDLR